MSSIFNHSETFVKVRKFIKTKKQSAQIVGVNLPIHTRIVAGLFLVYYIKFTSET